jgi:molybdenum cofactor cytidylyltransferase
LIPVTVVILAAGEARRFGSQKLLHPLPDGDTLLARAVRAAGDFDVVAVCGETLEPNARALGARTVRNDEPDRGMAHSLRLANAIVDADAAIAVLPADLLLIEADGVARAIAASEGYDVTYPRRADGTPGHPVVFSPFARALIIGLRDKEPIARVRDAELLSRTTLAVDEDWPYRDVDTPSDLP